MTDNRDGIGVWIDAKRWRGLCYFKLREGKWVCCKALVPAAQFLVGWTSTDAKAFCEKNQWEFRRVGAVKT